MTENILFNLGYLFIVIDEMDAIRCKEWRIFPGLNLLSDKLGFTIFLFSHIPIFGLLFLELANNPNSKNLIIYLEVFFIANLLLHLIYLRNPNNLFKDYISWTFIIATALFGIIDLVLKI
jgi:hypothetical protein